MAPNFFENKPFLRIEDQFRQEDKTHLYDSFTIVIDGQDVIASFDKGMQIRGFIDFRLKMSEIDDFFCTSDDSQIEIFVRGQARPYCIPVTYSKKSELLFTRLACHVLHTKAHLKPIPIDIFPYYPLIMSKVVYFLMFFILFLYLFDETLLPFLGEWSTYSILALISYGVMHGFSNIISKVLLNRELSIEGDELNILPGSTLIFSEHKISIHDISDVQLILSEQKDRYSNKVLSRTQQINIQFKSEKPFTATFKSLNDLMHFAYALAQELKHV